MKISKSEIIKRVVVENGVRIIFQHEDEDSTIYGPYIINRPNSKGIEEAIERHGYFLELQYNFEPNPEEEKKALIDNLLQYNDDIIKEVLDLSDNEVSSLRNELISKRDREPELPSEPGVKDPGNEGSELGEIGVPGGGEEGGSKEEPLP